MWVSFEVFTAVFDIHLWDIIGYLIIQNEVQFRIFLKKKTSLQGDAAILVLKRNSHPRTKRTNSSTGTSSGRV